MTAPPSLRTVGREDIMAVTPNPQTGFSAQKFAPHDAFTTLVGDEDADKSFWESILAENIDALLWKKDSTGRSVRDLYISTKEPIGDHVNSATGGVSGGAVASPGDGASDRRT